MVKCFLVLVVVLGSLSYSQPALDLFNAARDGDREAVASALQAGADINSVDDYGQTPLMYAVSWNRLGVVLDLVRAGADVNAGTAAGWTALHYAARDNARFEIPYYLLHSGADDRRANEDGQYPSDLARLTGNDVFGQAVRTHENVAAVDRALASEREAAAERAAAERAATQRAATERRAEIGTFSRFLGERPEDMAFEGEWPMATGSEPGWNIGVFRTEGSETVVRVYVANIGTDQTCRWTVDLRGAWVYPGQFGHAYWDPTAGRFGDWRYLPAFSYRVGNSNVALIADVAAGHCERRVF